MTSKLESTTVGLTFKQGDLAESNTPESFVVMVSGNYNDSGVHSFAGIVIWAGDPKNVGNHTCWNKNQFKRFTGRVILEQ